MQNTIELSQKEKAKGEKSNERKILTAERLNQGFRERADNFEYPNEKVDWKTPQHVDFASKIESKIQFGLDFYHKNNVAKTKYRKFDFRNMYEDDEQFFVQQQMRRNADEVVAKSALEAELKGMPMKSPLYQKIYQVGAVLTTLAAVAANGIYIMYFNFANTIIRTGYLFFVVLHPVSIICANCCITHIYTGIQK